MQIKWQINCRWINKINPNHNIEKIPISDGGEGSIDFLKKTALERLLNMRL